jgi:hypothetical protein
MAKATAERGDTWYVPEGCAVPDTVPVGVRLVGPGVELEQTQEQGSLTLGEETPTVVSQGRKRR